jgi:membrane fusion protein, multidrug efflux system
MSSPQHAISDKTHQTESPQPPPPGGKGISMWVPLLAAVLIAVFAIFAVIHRNNLRKEREQSAAQAAKLLVNMVTVKRDAAAHSLSLPGDVEAFKEATLYARTNGYIKTWYKDIGASVKEGDLIAEIEAPDVDAQLRQAQANLLQAKANQDIASLNFEREKDLFDKKVVSQQDLDTARTTKEAQDATQKGAEASLQNLQVQQGFQKITAPFTGTVTRRSIDIGDLVSAGSSTAGTLLFQLQQTDPLRIYVNVPQTNAPSIHVGMKAKILVQEYPGRDFEGEVTRTAGAIDPASRTLLTEVDIPNPDGALYAGMYSQVKFTLQDPTPPILIPANTFEFRAAGPQVAVVTKDNRIHWQTVKVGRDFGTQLEVESGLDENTNVVVNPTDDLSEGVEVQPTLIDDLPPGKTAGGK